MDVIRVDGPDLGAVTDFDRCTYDRCFVLDKYCTATLVVRQLGYQSLYFEFRPGSIRAVMGFLQAQDVAVICVRQRGQYISFAKERPPQGILSIQ